MKIRFFLLLAVLPLLLCACGGPEAAADPVVKTLSAEQAKARMDSGDSVTVVDVRAASEYTTAHIDGALLIDNDTILETQPALLPKQDAEILVYCRTGRRSAEAAKKLLALGYTNVSDFGGIEDWPYETVAGEFVPPEPEGVLTDFACTDVAGNPVDETILEEFAVTAVNVWGTFCGPCKDEMPDLQALSQDYRDKGLQIIALTADATDRKGEIVPEQVELAGDLAEALGVTYPVLIPSPELVAQVTSQIQAVPAMFFVDSSGVQIGQFYVSAKSKADWIVIFDELLAQYG